MSRQQERKALKESLQDLKREDLEDVMKVQQYVVGVTMGQYPFEHPNAPRMAPGTRYMPNQNEVAFTQESRSTLYSNFFRFMLVGALTPYCTLRALSIIQKRIIPGPRYVIWSSLGGAFGGMYGMTLGRMSVARNYLRLEGSPLATEARYQLFKINPDHPFLRGFEHESNEWEHTKFDGMRDEYKQNEYDPYNDNEYDRNIQRRKMGQTGYGRDRRSGYDQYSESRNVDEHALRKKKRDRFYQGRNRVNMNSLNEEEEDLGEFFDGRHRGHDPKEEVGDFFEGGSDQKWG